MISRRHRVDPYFVRYVRQLIKLHALIAQGKGDEEEADRLRDEMEEPWRHLSSEEIALLDDLSADLYTVGESDLRVDRSPKKVVEEFKTASERGDWKGVLALVRKYEGTISAAEATGLRGMAWARLGLPEAAIPFFQEAMRLNPTERMFQLCYLSGLIEANRLDEALAIAEEIIRTSSDPARLLKAAEVYFVWAATLGLSASAMVHRKAIEVAEKALALFGDDCQDETMRQLVLGTQLHRSLSYWALGELDHAVQACQAALDIEPADLYAMHLMDSLSQAEHIPSQTSELSQRDHRTIARSLVPGPADYLSLVSMN
jgi:hypothetical protein